MIAIKDMEIPKCCHWDCPLCNEEGGDCFLGAYDPKTDTNTGKERAKNCPLVEIITCKDCKHRNPGTDICDIHEECVPLEHYCADAKR